jgi:hypothetical protein
MQSEQRAGAPERGRSQQYNEKDPDESIRDCAFAPALEHGRQSNEKEDDREYRKALQQHDFLRGKRRRGNAAAKSEGLQ